MSFHLGDELLPLLGLQAAEDGVQQAGLADEEAPDGRRADVGILGDALDRHRLVAVRDEGEAGGLDDVDRRGREPVDPLVERTLRVGACAGAAAPPRGHLGRLPCS